MAKPTLKLALLLPLIFSLFQSARSETIADRIEWPPVFERSYGTPSVVVKESERTDSKVVFLRPARLVTVKVPCGCSSSRVNCVLADYFLCLLWEGYLAPGALSENEIRLNMSELIPMQKQTFVKIGLSQLAGRSSGNCVHDAWWKVRTGQELTKSCDHLLAIANLERDDPDAKIAHGHFAFALRKRCGNPSKDALYDFRAPWHEDRRPRVTEAPNVHNVLKLKGLRENLYDWLYTQSEFRNQHVTLSFVAVHEEQITLLRAYNGHVHEAGNFRVFKKNCASLGIQFVNRLLPLDEKIKGEHSFADVPSKAGEATIEHLGGLIKEVKIDNKTLELGREPTAKSKLHTAQPSRKRSSPFKVLSKVAEIN